MKARTKNSIKVITAIVPSVIFLLCYAALEHNIFNYGPMGIKVLYINSLFFYFPLLFVLQAMACGCFTKYVWKPIGLSTLSCAFTLHFYYDSVVFLIGYLLIFFFVYFITKAVMKEPTSNSELS